MRAAKGHSSANPAATFGKTGNSKTDSSVVCAELIKQWASIFPRPLNYSKVGRYRWRLQGTNDDCRFHPGA
jgi:hypothetical protein